MLSKELSHKIYSKKRKNNNITWDWTKLIKRKKQSNHKIRKV